MSEQIGALYPTQIPAYSETADIQAAFRLYHYGSSAYDTENEDPAELVEGSIAYTLNDFQNQIDTIDPAGKISETIIDAKGDLIVGASSDTPSKLSVGSNNFVLTADNAQTLGVKWAAPDVSQSNAVTLTNKTLTSPIVDGSGIIFEGATADAYETTLTVTDPTADRTITLPNATGTVDLQELSFNTQSGTTYTFVLADQSKMITASNASAQTYSIPTNASVAFPVGTQIHIIQIGAGQVTISATTPATTTVLSSSSINANNPKTRVQYSSATCIKAATDTWYVIGDIV